MPRLSSFLRMVLVCMAALMMAGSAYAQSAAFADVQKRLHKGRSHALLIGISQYTSQNQLPWVDEEIRRVEKAFSNAGITTYRPEQVDPRAGSGGTMNKKQLVSAIDAFLDKFGADPENRLIFYFASHGFAANRPGERAEGIFVTSDVGKDPEGEGFGVDELSAQLGRAQARHIFIFVNACYGAAMSPVLNNRSAEAFEKTQSGDDERSEFIQGRLRETAWMFLSAGTELQTVPDEKSPFALAVASGLGGDADLNGDGYILGMELAVFVRDRVPGETQKLGNKNDPIFGWLNKEGNAGDFVFKSPAGPKVDPKPVVLAVADQETAARNDRLARLFERRSFTECTECPIMNAVDVGKRGRNPVVGISRTELTYLEWDACYRELGCTRYIDDGGLGRGTRAVGGLTWIDAVQYIAWLNDKRRTVVLQDGTEQASQCAEYRFPTKSEWKEAAMLGKKTRFTWGSDSSLDRASCWGCGGGQDGEAAMSVGSFLANDNGLFDMTGNLWEWVQDVNYLCDAKALALPDGVCTPGAVMGGSYATRFDQLDTLASASIPRTRSPAVAGQPDVYSLPTVGLRVACTLKTP